MDEYKKLGLSRKRLWKIPDEYEIPSKEQAITLLHETINQLTEINGIQGIKFISNTNGNYIFVPYAGYYDNSTIVCNEDKFGLWTTYINDKTMASIIWGTKSRGHAVYGPSMKCKGFNIRTVKQK